MNLLEVTVKRITQRLLGEILIFKNTIGLRWENNFPRLVIHERYENIVRWLLRVLTVVGVASSVISFPWFISLALSIFLLAIETFFERSVFQFITIFVQPIPEWNGDEWLGLVFLIPQVIGSGTPKIGLLFRRKEYAETFFKVVRSWNYDQSIDYGNNICISIILDNDEANYFAFIFPSYERQSISIARMTADRAMLEKRQLKEQRQLIVSIMICKEFPNPPTSSFRKFQQAYSAGQAYFLSSFSYETNFPSEITESGAVTKYHLKIKKLSELSQEDIEYAHCQRILKERETAVNA